MKMQEIASLENNKNNNASNNIVGLFFLMLSLRVRLYVSVYVCATKTNPNHAAAMGWGVRARVYF